MTRILACIIIFHLSVLAQNPAEVHEEVKVTLQQFQVNVLSRGLKPIKGLTKKDFQVFIKGDLQEIQSVIPIESGEPFEDERLIPEAARRLFVLTFDQMNNDSQSIEKARAASREFVQNDFTDFDLASIFFIDMNGVYMIQNFTNDREALLRAIDHYVDRWDEHRMEQRVVRTFVKASGNTQKAERKEKETGDKSAMADAAIAEILQKADEMNQDAIATHPQLDYLINFEILGKSLATVEGRKNMIVFSKGMFYPGKHFSMLVNQQRHLAEALMGSNTLVFGVDTSRQNFRSAKGNLTFLTDLSGSTGGRLFSNYNRYHQVVSRVGDMTRHSYLVSVYVKGEAKEGRLSRVKIKVDRPGAKVLYPKGRVLNPEPFENELTHALENANAIQGPILEELPTKMDVSLAQNQDMGLVRVSLKIPGKYLVDISKPGEEMVLTVHTRAFDTGQAVVAESSRSVRFEPHKQREALEKTGIQFLSDLELSPGANYRVESHVLNETTGQEVKPSVELNIPNLIEGNQ